MDIKINKEDNPAKVQEVQTSNVELDEDLDKE